MAPELHRNSTLSFLFAQWVFVGRCAGFPRTDFSLNDASFAANMDVLTQVKVEYETLPGWCCSTETARSFEELPVQAQNYIRFIEDFLQVPGL